MRSPTRYVGRVVQLFAGGLLLALSAGASSDASSLVTEGSKAAGLDACVEATPVMRRNHMEFLKHQRDETVHRGIRGTKHSLAGCVDCHASRDGAGEPIPVNGDGQFCQTCHSYTAVSIDCFQCHRSIPREETVSAAHAPSVVPVVRGLASSDPGSPAAAVRMSGAMGVVASDIPTANRRD
jgi:hypothetical protein